MSRIEVRARALGGDGIPAVLLDLEAESITARELIRRTVHEQVREVLAGRGAALALHRQYRSEEELRARAGRGGAPPDPDTEVERALEAFARGRVVLFTGGRQITGLDEEIVVRLDEPVLFLRMASLVGG